MSDFGTFSLADIALRGEQVGALRDQRQARQQEQESAKTLASILPAAVQGDPAARQQLAQVGTPAALEWYMKLDDRERAQHQAQVSEAVQAVRWADTPEKWQQAKAYFAQRGMQVPDVPFEARDQVALELGQIGAYMESAPKVEWKTVEAGGAGGTFNPQTGQFTPVIAPNPGDQQFGATAAGEERKSVGGRSFVKRGGQWFEETGASNGAGTFQP